MNLIYYRVHYAIQIFIKYKSLIKEILNSEAARAINLDIPEEYIDLISFYRVDYNVPVMDEIPTARFEGYYQDLKNLLKSNSINIDYESRFEEILEDICNELNEINEQNNSEIISPITLEKVDNASLINLLVFMYFAEFTYEDQLEIRKSMFLLLTLNMNLNEITENILANIPEEHHQNIRLIIQVFNEAEDGNEILQNFQHQFNICLRAEQDNTGEEDTNNSTDQKAGVDPDPNNHQEDQENESIKTYSSSESSINHVFLDFTAPPPSPASIEYIIENNLPPPPSSFNNSHVESSAVNVGIALLGINVENQDFSYTNSK